MAPKTDRKIILLTSDQVVQKLGLKNRSSLHNAVHRGHIPRGKRIAGVGVRWDEAALDRWVAEHFGEA